MTKAPWRVIGIGVTLWLSTIHVFARREGESPLLPPAAVVLHSAAVSRFPGSHGNQKDVREGSLVFVLDRWEIDGGARGEKDLFYQVFNSSGIFGWINANMIRPEPYTPSTQDLFLIKSIHQDLLEGTESRQAAAVRALGALSEPARGAYMSSIVNDILSLRSRTFGRIILIGREGTSFVEPLLYCLGQIETFSPQQFRRQADYAKVLVNLSQDIPELQATLATLSTDSGFRYPRNFDGVLNESYRINKRR